MSYRVESARAAEEIRRVADEEIVAALSGLADADRAAGVHEARRRLKRLRALLRLGRTLLGRRYRAENRRFRDLGRRLAGPRDAQVVRESFDRFFAGPRSREVTALRELLAAEASRASPSDRELRLRIQEVVNQLSLARARAARWPILPSAGFAELEPGVKRTYRRARRAFRRAKRSGTIDVFHEWRKRVKYHREHIRFLTPLWRRPMMARRRSLSRVSDLLGEAHDLAVLHEWLRRAIEREAVAHVEPRALQRLDQRRLSLERLALPAGQRLFAEKPSAFARRLGIFWQAWMREQR